MYLLIVYTAFDNILYIRHSLLEDDLEIQAAFANSVSKQLPTRTPTGSSGTKFNSILVLFFKTWPLRK